MQSDGPTIRMIAVSLPALGLILALRFAMLGGGTAPARVEAPGAGGSICFDLAGAVGRPGFRCARSATVSLIDPLPPCDDPETVERIERTIRACPLHGRRLVVRPLVSGGPCVPRVESLGGSMRLALGLRIELAAATVEDLTAIEGVGRGTAERILQARPRIRSLDDLAAVEGIGPVRLRTLRERLAIGEALPEACAARFPHR